VLPLIDIAFISFCIFFEGGPDKPYYLFYTLFIVFFSMFYEFKYTLVSGLFCTLTYGTIMFILEGTLTHNVVIRIGFFIIFTVFTGLFNRRLYNYSYDMAVKDGLTSLYNHKYIVSTLEHYIRFCKKTGSKVSIAMIDLDNFKKYNDTYGHYKGDMLLKKISDIISGNIRETDLAARYGGDELAVLFPSAGHSVAEGICERIRQAVKNALYPDNEYEVTLSMGIATFPDDGSDTSELIKCADNLLYAAKKLGKDEILSKS
jgi:diguanylate cyclase (GGDEF)-like protein